MKMCVFTFCWMCYLKEKNPLKHMIAIMVEILDLNKVVKADAK
jgi:hypothetical protein